MSENKSLVIRIIIFAVMCLILYKVCFSPSSESTPNSSSVSSDGISKDDKAMCWTLAIDTVKDNLKSPSSAKFPSTFISKGVSFDKEGDTYYVAGWVDADNSFDANIRSGFLVKLEKNGEEDFEVISCSIEGN